jgi:hypothetical protein
MRLRPALKRLLVLSLKASDNVVALKLDQRSTVSADLLLALASKQPKRYRLRPEGVLMMTTPELGGWDMLVDEIEKLLARLESGETGGLTDDRSKQQPTPVRSFRRAVR